MKCGHCKKEIIKNPLFINHDVRLEGKLSCNSCLADHSLRELFKTVSELSNVPFKTGYANDVKRIKFTDVGVYEFVKFEPVLAKVENREFTGYSPVWKKI